MSDNKLAIRPKEGFLKRIYLQRQRNKIEKIVEETGQLLPAFQLAYKKGNIGLFLEFLEENNLQETFVKNSFDDFINLNSRSQKEKACFADTAENVGISFLGKVYGEAIEKKLQDLSKEDKISFFDINQLAIINRKDNVEPQAQIISKLLDLCGDDTLTVGIHRTGGWENSGEIINNTGLNLTGHLSSGVDSRNFKNVKGKLEENISFDDTPGSMIRQIAIGGNYKNYASSKSADISIIAIPNEELQKTDQSIIINYNGQQVLNPKFIKGYVKVDTQNDTLEQYVENPRCVVKQKNMDFRSSLQEIQSTENNRLETQKENRDKKRENEER